MVSVSDEFGPCEICGTHDWRVVYNGSVRDGTFGNVRDNARLAGCPGCGVHRLSETHCLSEGDYENDDYRARIGQGMDLAGHHETHDHLQQYALHVIPQHKLRGLSVADVGAGGGSFLDHVSGIAGRTIAIEPANKFRTALAAKGYEAFDYSASALEALGPVVDIAVSLQVIEHVRNPKEYLVGIRELLKPGGRVVVSTPNRADILMELLPDVFPAFFYRVVHRWYFDSESLSRCASEAGLVVEETRHIHRYGMANALLWLKNKSPSGRATLDGIDGLADGFWKAYLETSGRSDTLFVTLRKC